MLADLALAAHVQGVHLASWRALLLPAGLLLGLLTGVGLLGSFGGAGFGLAAALTAFAWVQAPGPPAWAATPLRAPLFWVVCWAAAGLLLELADEGLRFRDGLRRRLMTGLLAAPVLLAALLALQVAKSDRPSPASDGVVDGNSDPRPPILLITIDTLRADALTPETAPNLTALGSESIVFSQARSSGPWTAPGFSSMLSGVSPWVHGALWLGTTAAPELPFLADRLHEAGYSTAAIGSNFILSSWGAKYRFDHGFDEFRFYPFTQLPATRALERLRESRPKLIGLDAATDDLAEQAGAWLDRQDDDSFFLWLHFYDPHAPYEPPSDFYPPGEAHPDIGPTAQQVTLDDIRGGERPLSPAGAAWLRALYDAELRHVDDRIGRVLDKLRASGRFDESLIVVASDHGEEFFEHGGLVHGWTLYDEQLRVPLLIKPPGPTGGQRLDQPVGTIDLAPTVLELAGVSYDEAAMQGRSLVCLWAETPCEAPQKPQFATGLIGERQQHSVVFEGLKLIEEPEWGRTRLFDLAADPGESIDLSPDRPDDVARGRALLDQHAAESAELRRRLGLQGATPAGYDDASRDRLRSLGYIQ